MQSFPRIGILGGGQLGKMLCIAAGPMHLPISILDQSVNDPAAPYCHDFVRGSFAREEDVLRFGQQLDIVTIEIEHVHTGALRALRDMGVHVYPDPDVLDTINDKGLQKQFFRNNGLPTAGFTLYPDASLVRRDLQRQALSLPFVQKARKGGYDGKGVHVVRSGADLDNLLDCPCVVEQLVDFVTELAVVVARTPDGQTAVYDPVSMVFHPTANLVELLVCPAETSAEIALEAKNLAIQVAQSLQVVGLLAVEMFLLPHGQLLINEVAPRPHNSGHHTIEAAATSQFEQHLRAIMNWPLGSTALRRPAAMVNLLGAPGFSGKAVYKGLEKVLAMPDVHIHLYGKSETRPFRKMGHATILANSGAEAAEIARQVLETLHIEA
jgi:5-(carboxyamino)imidazole ribonucleotide synthase